MCLGKQSIPCSHSGDSAQGFNEAEAHVPRKTRINSSGRPSAYSCFNEAEAHVPRKTRLVRLVDTLYPTGFNEAEAHVPRKTRSIPCSERWSRTLQ